LEAQSYRDFQHVIVSDGEDEYLRGELSTLGYRNFGNRVFVELGRNWHGFLGGDGANLETRGSRAVSPAMVGTYLAAGAYIAYLDDDCAYKTTHLDLLSTYLDHIPTLDMVFGQMERFVDNEPWDTVGDGVMEMGHVDGNMVVHRAELLRIANWKHGPADAPYADWNVIQAWVDGGARWMLHPEVTVSWYGTS
jgi:hypothetical protein